MTRTDTYGLAIGSMIIVRVPLEDIPFPMPNVSSMAFAG
jgi:hypothetical protein